MDWLFAEAIREHLELRERNAGLQGAMPLERYPPMIRPPTMRSSSRSRQLASATRTSWTMCDSPCRQRATRRRRMHWASPGAARARSTGVTRQALASAARRRRPTVLGFFGFRPRRACFTPLAARSANRRLGLLDPHRQRRRRTTDLRRGGTERRTGRDLPARSRHLLVAESLLEKCRSLIEHIRTTCLVVRHSQWAVAPKAQTHALQLAGAQPPLTRVPSGSLNPWPPARRARRGRIGPSGSRRGLAGTAA